MKTSLQSPILCSRHNVHMLVRRKSEVVVVYLVLIMLVLIAGISNNVFFTMRNLRNLMTKSIGLLLVTYAQLIIISLGGVDLSIGSIISVVNVLAVTLMKNEEPLTWGYAILVCLAVGFGIGLINGLLVVYGKMQPIIATLATQTIFAGVALLILPAPKGQFPAELCSFITKGWNYAFPILLVFLCSVGMWVLMYRTRFGRALFAVGGNEQAAECSGIRVGLTKISAFSVSGLVAAIAALYISLYATSGNPLIGNTYTQLSITTTVVAGASLSGGKSSVVGCLAAAGIIGIINNMLNLMRISSFYQFVIQGVILIMALAISTIRSKK